MKTFFSIKHSFFIIFSNFSNFNKVSDFSRKNLKIKAKKTFLRNNTIW